jgi:hypothetical protein
MAAPVDQRQAGIDLTRVERWLAQDGAAPSATTALHQAWLQR